MSLSQALATAVSGLRANQIGMSVVSANVANAETPGYVRKTPVQIATVAGDLGVSVRVAAINRELDQFVQRQLRVESSGASYAGLRAEFYERLQYLYGEPGAPSTLESVFNDFTVKLQALTTSPESLPARMAVLSAAQVLTQQLNTMTGNVQSLRSDAELGLSDAVTKANEAMQRIAGINQQLATQSANDATTAALLDQRDNYIDVLAQLMDIRLIPNDNNQVTVFTTSGIQLVGTQASRLAFDPQGTMTPAAHWSEDPAERGVGTIVLQGPNGSDLDLIATKSIRSGKIAAYLEMRDQVLVEAQAQLDEIAAGLARALSDRTVAGTPVSFVPQDGFEIDIGGLLDGNTVSLNYTDAASVTHQVTIVRVSDPSVLPLDDDATTRPDDRVIGIDFSGGMASVVAQLNAALGGSQLQFSNPAGTTLRVLDDGAGNLVTLNAVSATSTVTSLTAGTPELPFFLDDNTPYSGAITAIGSQTTGLAGRLVVNAALAGDPTRLVVFETTPLTPSGDGTRPNFIFDRLTGASIEYSPRSGIGTADAPFVTNLPAFMRQIVSQQGEAAEAAASLKAGQEVVFNSLQQRFSEGAGVNIDEEMANLLNLQNAYGANARVLTTIREMFDMLLNL